MVLSVQELYDNETMLIAGMGNKKIAITLGLPQSTKKRRLKRLHSGDDMVPRNVGRPRGAEARLCL